MKARWSRKEVEEDKEGEEEEEEGKLCCNGVFEIVLFSAIIHFNLHLGSEYLVLLIKRVNYFWGLTPIWRNIAAEMLQMLSFHSHAVLDKFSHGNISVLKDKPNVKRTLDIMRNNISINDVTS